MIMSSNHGFSGGFYRVFNDLLGFQWLQWTLPGFTGFSVAPTDVTGFYRVFRSFEVSFHGCSSDHWCS